jgi:TonB family protein
MLALLVLAVSLIQDAPAPTPHKTVTIPPKTKFATEPNISRCNLPSDYSRLVVVGLTVDINGKPQGLQVLQPSGNDCADKSALFAVSQYRFIPASRDGVAVAVQLRVQVPVRGY